MKNTFVIILSKIKLCVSKILIVLPVDSDISAGPCLNDYLVADGFCDDDTNNLACNFDGGDCCGFRVLEEYCDACNCHEGEGQNILLVFKAKLILQGSYKPTLLKMNLMLNLLFKHSQQLAPNVNEIFSPHGPHGLLEQVNWSAGKQIQHEVHLQKSFLG